MRVPRDLYSVGDVGTPVVVPCALGDPTRAARLRRAPYDRGSRAGRARGSRRGRLLRPQHRLPHPPVLLAPVTYVALETLRFLPVGVLTVLSLARTRRDRSRMLLVAATAGAGTLLIAVVVLAVEIGPPWQWPGPSDSILPAIGCLLGVSLTLVWLAGRPARRRLLVGLGPTLLAAPILVGLVLIGTAEREPLVRESPAVTSDGEASTV